MIIINERIKVCKLSIFLLLVSSMSEQHKVHARAAGKVHVRSIKSNTRSKGALGGISGRLSQCEKKFSRLTVGIL